MYWSNPLYGNRSLNLGVLQTDGSCVKHDSYTQVKRNYWLSLKHALVRTLFLNKPVHNINVQETKSLHRNNVFTDDRWFLSTSPWNVKPAIIVSVTISDPCCWNCNRLIFQNLKGVTTGRKWKSLLAVTEGKHLTDETVRWTQSDAGE